MSDRPKLLAVDDRSENLLALRRVLGDLDVEIVEASSGNAALTATLSHDFAVAILDVQMPGMDGFELADLLRGDPKTCSVPIIFLTAAFCDEEQIFRGYEAGAVDYIIKPYSPKVLRSKVVVFLELSRRSVALAEKVAALAASEERFRSLVMTVPDIVYRIDPEGRFTFLNNAVSHLGYQPEELIGTHFSALLLPGEVEAVSRVHVIPKSQGKVTGPEGSPKLFDERRTAGRKTAGLEVRLVPKQEASKIPGLIQNLGHDTISVEVNSSGLYAVSGGRGDHVFLGTVGIIRDISERKRTMEELEKHRSHLQAMVDERVKEQTCLARVSEIIASSVSPIPETLSEVAQAIPAGWQNPDCVYVRLTLDDLIITTESFVETGSFLAEDIELAGAARGSVEVFQGVACPEGECEGFLDEERNLLRAIARLIGLGVGRREASAELRNSARSLQQILDSACFGVMVVGLDRRIRLVNRAALELSGQASIEELVGVFCNESLCSAAKGRCPILDLGETMDLSERVLITADGREVPIIKSVSRIELDGEDCLLETFVDISKRKSAEEALQRSEAWVRQLFDLSPEAIFVVGADGSFLDVNQVATTRYGYTREEFFRMGPEDLAPADLKGQAGAKIERGKLRKSLFEWSHQAKDGHEIPVEIHSVPFVVEGAPCVLSSVRDITERRAAEVERRQLQMLVIQSQRMESVGTLASGVAHEINNPLNIVMNFAQLIQDEAGVPDAARDYAQTIVEESLRMAGIVRNLLAFSRDEKESHSPASIQALVENTLTLIGAAFRKDQIEVALEIPEALPKIQCRSQQIQQVLLNLLTNARDALNQRYPGADPAKRICIHVEDFEREGEPWIRLTVEDSAGGLSPDLGEHIFSPFFTTKSKDRGTGLGLSISHGIVKEHRGELWFESEPDVATRFHIELKVGNGWSLGSEIVE